MYKYCKKCGAETSRKTYPCRDCDVCIQEYDHHCPWVSKCIGKGNLYFFYVFVTVTPIYIMCFIGLMMGALVNAASQMNHAGGTGQQGKSHIRSDNHTF